MTTTTIATSRFDNMAAALMRAGVLVSRYGLVVVLAWIGFGKYVKMEARVLIEHSPLMSWIYDYLSVTTVGRGPRDDGNRCRASYCIASGLATRVDGRQRVGRGVVHGHIELLVHNPGGGRHSRCRRTCTDRPAGPIPSQRLGAHRCGSVEFG